MYVFYLALLAFVLSACIALVVRNISRRINAFDTAPIHGQVKAVSRRIPNTGGIAVFWAIILPMIIGLIIVNFVPGFIIQRFPAAAVHVDGLITQTPTAVLYLGCITLLHVLGLIDDRKPLGPWTKLIIMIIPAVAVATLGRTRLLTAADAVMGGAWFSIVLTVLWFIVVTNAMNFIDNMDGLCAGVAGVAGAFFLLSAILSGQWFVAAMLGLLVGACAGFLLFNRPPASLFLGDGGSLIIGYTLAFLTVRGTYIPAALAPGDVNSFWYGVLTPLVVLAVPLYDFVTVTLVRLRAGKSPFVGDLNHLSHRLTRRGLSKPAAVASILLLTASTGVSGLLLREVNPTGAVLIGVQVLCILLVVARIEFAGGATQT